MGLHIQTILSNIRESIQNNTFIKLNLGEYKGAELELKKLFLKPVLIKKKLKISFVYRYKTKDITKNYFPDEAILILVDQIKEDGFKNVQLFTVEHDIKAHIINASKINISKSAPSITERPNLIHDHVKKRKITSEDKHYLTALKITDQNGKVLKQAQNKYKQINHYIEVLSKLIERLPNDEMLKVVDMGSGKGYLTFALYDYLNNSLNRPSSLKGIEFRNNLVDLCNQIASNSKFDNLIFEEGTIKDYNPNEKINMLIALHACDTATDEAIFKGITNDADLIVVAPCCHKQIRKEIEKSKSINELQFLTQYGIFLERQAEMVTDGIRALILNYYDYDTKVFEFISDAHTPKNVMIVAEKRKSPNPGKEKILSKINKTKSYFGIHNHHLEVLMGMTS